MSMMLYYERQLALEIAYTLPMYTDCSRGGRTRYNFRCPICGDSAKDKYAARGWFYEYNGHMRYGCFNCSRNFNMSTYLKLYQEERYRDYIKEKFKDDRKPAPERAPMPTEEEMMFESVTELPYCDRLDLLPKTHPVVRYMVERRMLPEHTLELFFFTKEWRKLANEISPETYSRDDPESRLIIPIYNLDRTISTIQGRALGSNVDPKQRYLTIKKDPFASKVFGRERVDPTKTVYFHEGPIDSVFIPNSLAIVGGSMALSETPYKDKRVWILDNEPRSKETVERIHRLVEANEKVVLWDECKWTMKDINDMIVKEGATPEMIHDYIKNNIVKGLSAKRRLANWRKV